jgi:hypothetical protein
LMIYGRQPVRRSSFSREISVIPTLSGGIIIKSAGEPLSDRNRQLLWNFWIAARRTTQAKAEGSSPERMTA